MQLTNENYYSQEANKEYMSVSQFKDFAGTYGKLRCEFAAMEKLEGRWEEEKTTALMVGSYVDSYFEGTLDKFKADNPSLFKKDGGLKAEYNKANEIISRIESDEYFMKYMSGQKQVIMTGELFGSKWKIKIDNYIPNVAIVDLKIMSSITKLEWVSDIGYLDFVRYWGYDIQGAIYQEIVKQNSKHEIYHLEERGNENVEIFDGYASNKKEAERIIEELKAKKDFNYFAKAKKTKFYIAAATKEKEPDIRIIHVTDNYLEEALNVVEANMPRILRVKNGESQPDRCELCDCCRHNRILTKPISIMDLTAGI